MKTIKATTELRCDRCSYLEILNKKTMFKNDQKPWTLVCPHSNLIIEIVTTSKGMEEQKLPDIPAPWDCVLRAQLRKQKVEHGIELSINC